MHFARWLGNSAAKIGSTTVKLYLTAVLKVRIVLSYARLEQPTSESLTKERNAWFDRLLGVLIPAASVALPFHFYRASALLFVFAGLDLALLIALNLKGKNYFRLLAAIAIAAGFAMIANFINDWFNHVEMSENSKAALVVERAPIKPSGSPAVAPKPSWKPSVDVDMAPIVSVHRSRDERGNLMNGAQYGLAAILRIRNKSKTTPYHVRSLQVVGDVRVDCGVYGSVFPADGTITEDFINAECLRRKPYFQLSWISHPLGEAHVQPRDEEFVRFNIASRFTAIEYVGDLKDYLGYGDSGARPKFPLTSPYPWFVVQAVTINPKDQTVMVFALRDEVKAGRVKIRMQIDNDVVDVPIKNIQHPRTWAGTFVEQAINQDLFYGIDNGRRVGVPTPTDPLVKPR